MTGGTYREVGGAEELGRALQGAMGDVAAAGPQWGESPQLSCHAIPLQDHVFCEGWPEGAEFALQIDDPDTGPGQGPSPDYAASGLVEVSTWNPESTRVEFSLWDTYDLQPGDLITASGAGWIKEHTVTGLKVLAVDLENDVVRGVATPGNRLELYTNPPDAEVFLTVAVGPDGNWEADFRGLFDIDSSTTVEVEEWDEDGDTTHATWPWPPP